MDQDTWTLLLLSPSLTIQHHRVPQAEAWTALLLITTLANQQLTPTNTHKHAHHVDTDTHTTAVSQVLSALMSDTFSGCHMSHISTLTLALTSFDPPTPTHTHTHTRAHTHTYPHHQFSPTHRSVHEAVRTFCGIISFSLSLLSLYTVPGHSTEESININPVKLTCLKAPPLTVKCSCDEAGRRVCWCWL